MDIDIDRIQALINYAENKYEGLEIKVKEWTTYQDILISMEYRGIKMGYALDDPDALEDVMILIITDAKHLFTNYGGKNNGHSKEESRETEGHDAGTIVHQDHISEV